MWSSRCLIALIAALAITGCGSSTRPASEEPTASEESTIAELKKQPSQRQMYIAEYAVCWGITVREVGRDYGFDTSGMTPNEVILRMEQESSRPEYQATAFEACLDAYYRRPSKY
jgi:hypothetical protein